MLLGICDCPTLLAIRLADFIRIRQRLEKLVELNAVIDRPAPLLPRIYEQFRINRWMRRNRSQKRERPNDLRHNSSEVDTDAVKRDTREFGRPCFAG
jgi:hypothetical protein